MAITTIDGALAGMQPTRFFIKALSGTLVSGRPFSYWGMDGVPGLGSFSSSLAGVALTSPTAGQIPFTNPGSGNSYLSRFVGNATQQGTLLLCDRLWHNGGFTITSTSGQTVTSATWPARDNAGSTNGDGVLLGMEISATTGNGTPTITATYTNQAGTGSKTAINVVPTVATSLAGSFYPLGLAAGDTGVRSVQTIQLSATWNSGTMNLVAYRILASLDISAAYTPEAVDALTGGFTQLFNDTVPFLIFIPSTTTTTTVHGTFNITQG